MPQLTPIHWLLGGLIFILLILLAFLASRHWRSAESTARNYRTANGRAIERDTLALQRQPIPRQRLRPGLLPSSMPIATPQGRPTTQQHADTITERLRTRDHIKSRAEWAARFDALHKGTRRPNPFATGTRNNITWFSFYEPTFEEKLRQMPRDFTVQTPAREAETMGG